MGRGAGRRRLRTSAGLFVLLFGTWLLLSGHYTSLLIGLGLVSCALVAWIVHRMEIVDDEGFPFHLALRVLRYLPWLTVEVVKSNLDLARRVLTPRMPIAQEMVELKSSQKTDLGRVSYANSITLTPSTVTIEARSDGTLLVHAVSRKAADDLRRGDMDRHVTRMEGSG